MQSLSAGLSTRTGWVPATLVAPGFSPGPAQAVASIWGVNQPLSWCLSFCLSNKCIFFLKKKSIYTIFILWQEKNHFFTILNCYICLYTYMCMKKLFLWKSYRGWGVARRSSICCFTPQMATMASGGSEWSQERPACVFHVSGKGPNAWAIFS